MVYAELASFQVTRLEVSWPIVFARVHAALAPELWLPTERYIALIPIESLIESVGNACLRLVAGVHWSHTCALILLIALILVPLQLLFIFLELLEMWAHFEYAILFFVNVELIGEHVAGLVEGHIAN